MKILEPRDFWRELRGLAHYIPSSSADAALNQIMPSLAALIFLRWADFQDREKSAIAEFDKGSYDPIVPRALRWEYLVEDKIARRRDRCREAVASLDRVSSSNGIGQQLARISDVIERTCQLEPELLDGLIQIVQSFSIESPADRELVGIALDTAVYELAEKSRSAEYFTPRTIVDLMVDIANPKLGERVYDPCFGMGGLLSACVRRMRVDATQIPLEKWVECQQNSVFGTEINLNAYAVGLARIAMAGFSEAGLELGNSLEQPLAGSSAKHKFDCVLAVPPWGGKVRKTVASHYATRTQNIESLFVQHVMEALKPGGRAVIAVPEGFLFRGGADEQIRRHILEEFKVESVVSLPAGSFKPYTMIKTNLLVFSREKPEENVTFYIADIERLNQVRSLSSPRTGLGDLPTWADLLTDIPTSSWPPNAGGGLDFILGQSSGGIAGVLGTESWDVFGSYSRPRKKWKRWGLMSALNAGLPRFWDSDIESPITIAAVEPVSEIAKRNWELTIKQGHERLDSLLSSLGQVDNSIPQVPLSKVANVAAGRSYRVSDFADYKSQIDIVGLVRVSDIVDGHVTSPAKYVAEDHAISDSQWLSNGDLALGITGSVGKVGLVEGESRLIASSGIAVIKPHREIESEYLFAILNSESYGEWMTAHARGTAAQHLPVSRLLQIPIPVPAMQIQAQLVERVKGTRLDALEELLNLLREEADSPLTRWLKSSTEVDSLFSLDIDGGRSDILRAAEKFLASIRQTRNQVVHSSEFIAPEFLLDWIVRLSEATENLTSITSIPEGASRYAIIESALAGIEKSTEHLTVTTDSVALRVRKITDRLRDILRNEVRSLLSNTQVEATFNYPEASGDRKRDVVLQLLNRSALPLRRVHVETIPDCGHGESAYWAEGKSLQIDLKPPLDLRERSVTVTAHWSGSRLDGTEVSGSVRLDVPFGFGGESSLKVDLGDNPYIYGNPIPAGREDVFFGRQQVIEQIKRQLNARTANVVLLEGNRRTGKSSILYRLTAPGVLDNWTVVNCSMQGARGVEGAGGIPSHEVFRLLAQRIAETLLDRKQYVPIDTAEIGSNPIPSRLEVTRKCLSFFSGRDSFALFDAYVSEVLVTIHPHRLLLMLDEFDKIQEGIESGVTSQSVPENLRYLIHRHENLSAILSGSPRLKHLRETYWSALFGLGFRIGVSRLAESDARQLIIQPVEGRLDYTREACDHIVSVTDCHPFLLQSICSHIFDLASSSDIRTISRQEVAKAIDAMVTNNEHFATIWGEYIRTARQRLIVAICGRYSDGPDPITLGFIGSTLESLRVHVPKETQLQDDMKELKELEVIEYTTDGRSPEYRISIPLLTKWLEQHISFDEIVRAAKADI